MPPRLRERIESPEELRAVRQAVRETDHEPGSRWSLRFAVSLCLLLLTLNIALSALFRNDPAQRLAAVEPAAAAPLSSERRGSLATYVSPNDAKPAGDPLDHTNNPRLLDTPAAAPVPPAGPLSPADKPLS